MADADQDVPSRSSNMEKAEGDRKSEWGEGTSSGATGVTNRPMDEDAPTIDNGRFGAGPDDPVMPGDDSTLKTKI